MYQNIKIFPRARMPGIQENTINTGKTKRELTDNVEVESEV